MANNDQESETLGGLLTKIQNGEITPANAAGFQIKEATGVALIVRAIQVNGGGGGGGGGSSDIRFLLEGSYRGTNTAAVFEVFYNPNTSEFEFKDLNTGVAVPKADVGGKPVDCEFIQETVYAKEDGTTEGAPAVSYTKGEKVIRLNLVGCVYLGNIAGTFYLFPENNMAWKSASDVTGADFQEKDAQVGMSQATVSSDSVTIDAPIDSWLVHVTSGSVDITNGGSAFTLSSSSPLNPIRSQPSQGPSKALTVDGAGGSGVATILYNKA